MEFDFDLAADTAYSVANEMVSDLSLSHEDAKVCTHFNVSAIFIDIC